MFEQVVGGSDRRRVRQDDVQGRARFQILLEPVVEPAHGGAKRTSYENLFRSAHATASLGSSDTTTLCQVGRTGKTRGGDAPSPRRSFTEVR